MGQSTRFKQTELGEIPEEWEEKRLEKVAARIYSGSSAPQDQKYFEGGIYPFVRVLDLARYGQTRNLVETTDKVNDMAVRELNLVLAPRGTIVFPKSGAALKKNHRAILGTDAYIVSHLAAIEVNHKVADTEFVFWWLCKVDMAAINPNPGYPSIRLQEIKALPIPLPPLEEQKRIAGVLRLVDEIIERTRQIINLYEKAKKYALSHLLTKGIGHTRFKQTELGEIPEEWEVIKIGDIAVLEMQQILASNLPSETLYIGMEHIESGTGRLVTNCLPTVTSVKGNVFCFNPTHILYGKLRPYLNKVFLPDFCGCCSTELVPVKPNPNKVLRSFLFYQMLSPRFVLYAQQFSEGTRMPRVNLQKFLEFLIPLPPLEEQKRIAEILSTIDKAIDNERRYLEALGKLKKWLLNNLLTGKVRLPEWVGDILKQVFPEG